MRPTALLTFLLSLALTTPAGTQPSPRAAARAWHVMLFLADAGGIPTIHAASLLATGSPRSLFVQSMPHVALVDTSAADAWVTDSAAGMTAIVTGRKPTMGCCHRDQTLSAKRQTARRSNRSWNTRRPAASRPVS